METKYLTYFKVFGVANVMLNNGKSNLCKFDSKANQGILLGYSLTSKTYRVYNKRALTVEEFIHVAFDECIENKTLCCIFNQGASSNPS